MDWLFPEEAAERRETQNRLSVREGSVGSAGGDSPLPGVMPPVLDISAGVSVSEALSIASVYRAVNILTTTISQLPIQVMRGDVEIEVGSANSNGWLRQPNPDITRTSFLHQTVFSLATTGNAYWRLYGVEAPGDSVMGLEVLNPQLMFIETDQRGRKYFRYTGYTQEKRFELYQVKHLKLTQPFGSDYGVGPIQMCQAELRGILELRNYAHNIFATGTFPTGIISVKDEMDPELAAQYQTAFIKMVQGGKPAVFGNGASYEPNTFDPQKAQFIDNQQFAITQVARMFGVPASKLMAAVEGNSMTYTNTEQVNREYVQDTLMGYIKPIEEALSDLIPRGQQVKLKVDGLMRADTTARYSALATATWMTPNEKRALDNLPPIPGGDVLEVPEPKAPEGNTQNGDNAQ